MTLEPQKIIIGTCVRVRYSADRRKAKPNITRSMVGKTNMTHSKNVQDIQLELFKDDDDGSSHTN